MKEADAPTLLDHFQRDVLSRIPGRVVSTLTIPHLSPAQLADPARLAPRHRFPLLNQVAVIGRPARTARLRTVQGASQFLANHHDSLLGSAREDVAALQAWRAVVESGQSEFDNRYQREYLASEKFPRFDQAMVRLIDLLDLPGVGKWVSGTLWVMRWPYQTLRGLAVKALKRPDTIAMPEQPVLEQALAGWLDTLRKEAVHRAGRHPLWAHIERGFASGLADQARERFQQGFRGFQLGQADEVERTARAVYEELEKNPTALNTLRGGKFVLDIAGITATLVAGPLSPWWHVVLVPVAASVTHQLVEWLGHGYVEGQREQARQRQQALMMQHLSGPLAEWLIQWPATGGSAYERLQLALRRLPLAVQQLHAAVSQRLVAAQNGQG
jgi:hypothetical protein